MDRKAFAVVGAIVLLVGAGLAFSLSGGGDEDQGSPALEPVTADAVSGSGSSGPSNSSGSGNGGSSANDTNAATPGEYVEYSPELVASTPGDKLLFFHASWCSQCVALEEDIAANGLPDGVTVFEVDYDTNQELRQKYGVTIQTTIVKVDQSGEMIDSYVAYEEPVFGNVEQALLQ